MPAISAGDFSSSFSDLGGAVSDLFSAQGDRLAAGSYRDAAKISRQNEALEAQSTAIKQAQLTRSIYMTEGQQKADVAGLGFSNSGSAIDIMRASAQQGALAHSLTALQGDIQVNAYKSQATAEEGQAATADTAAQGDTFGAIFKTIGAVLPFLALAL